MSQHYDDNRPHSIDLTLELERQLESESIPASPTAPNAAVRPQSLDTQVLASLVTTLRVDVTNLSKERDTLAAALEASKEREEDLRNEVHRMMESRASLDEQMEVLRHKNDEAEE